MPKGETPSFRDRIAAAAPPRKRERTTLCGVEVDIREMRAGEKHVLTDSSVTGLGTKVTKVPMAKYIPALLIACVVEPDTDTPVYTTSEADRQAINDLPAADAERAANIALRLSGLSAEADKVIVGNSEEASDD